MDSTIILVSSISLLKYTIARVPELETIQITIITFFTGTFKKTLPMVMMTYILFGMMSNYVLAVYQFGFAKFGYALLRTCIVFLSGFIINEQKVIYSFESVENLMRYNGFGLTFGNLLLINILIRQVMINIVAIFMHNDYH